MRIGGRWGARPAVAAVRQQALRVTRTPAFGLAVITPLVFAGAVAGAGPSFPGRTPPARTAVTPIAAVSASATGGSGPVVVAVKRPPPGFRVAAATMSAPPPPLIVNSPGALGIPIMALTAYRNAEQKMAATEPGCGVSWNLLAGIGRIESMHANGGATDTHGTALNPIYGPTLDGSLPGNEIIIQSKVGNRVTYARAMGPMQFLPGTWARYASDGDGDGVPDPQNLFDSTLAAARYLCSGGLNLRDPTHVMAAILRYNNSLPYAQNVLGWAAAYATGVVPVDLPPITGPPPPIGDAHLEHPEGLGPDLPLNVNGLGVNDPLMHMPLIDFGPPRPTYTPQPMWPWLPPVPQPQAPQPGCTLICITSQNVPDAVPPWFGQPPAGGIVIAPPAAPPPPDPLAPPDGPVPGSPPAPASPAAAGSGQRAPSSAPQPPAANPPAPGEPVLTPVS
ncbi:lytic murein transglycosylase [Mycobacterium shinjukuense]|uniref:Membrane protein n=1 Tax=Mycobacterium shinjukuense TaxID=398694 RepID=A0A7I7ML60_9MYCO|nr:lytic transglycosylase domain-containing protein [Mycobacterium shinjukuense]MCV6986794.1 lytic murein transglycosylase [Mycobacterium shinjukuense]ORB69601.1 lytic transglycosylase [Mycobacterium shinjukuense]BBX72527.1 membrane protein [Mycobacterium shinjukuense]